MGRGLYCKALRSLLLALVLLSLVGDGGCADNHGQSPVPGSPSGNDGGGESKKKTGIRKYMEDR